MRCSVMKGGLRGAAARWQGDSRCVCSDGGAVWRALLGALGALRALRALGALGALGVAR
ncbi:MAG: hypothetical protein PUC21_03255 [Bacteroidales bacterium]|nr:hypothetical protein [Bacteroidales bacterium]